MPKDNEIEPTEKKPRSYHGITRRGFLYGAGGIVCLAAVGGVGAAIGDDTSLMHPPGATTSADFLALCIRCDRCRSACPRNAIGVAKLESGLVALKTPVMEYRIGYCDTCGGEYRCIEACATGALGSFDTTRDKIGVARIDTSKCQTYQVSASCGRVCIDACPADALHEDGDGRVYVDGDACWGCGACEYVCPSNSYRTYDGSTLRGVNVWPLGGE